MESPLQFIPFLNALPELRVPGVNPARNSPQEVIFATRPLLEAMKTSPVCGF